MVKRPSPNNIITGPVEREIQTGSYRKTKGLLGLLLPNLIWHVIYIFDNGGANRVHFTLKGITINFGASGRENYAETNA